MPKTDLLVAEVLSAAGGEITGRVRMQKIFYLMQQLGMAGDFQFRFHHYGPYSKGLDEAIDVAKALRGLTEEIDYRASDGAPYSVFRAPQFQFETVGTLAAVKASEIATDLKSQSSTVLELAATIHWISTVEKIADWQSELKRRKGQKTEGGRAEKAFALLKKYSLAT